MACSMVYGKSLLMNVYKTWFIGRAALRRVCSPFSKEGRKQSNFAKLSVGAAELRLCALHNSLDFELLLL